MLPDGVKRLYAPPISIKYLGLVPDDSGVGGGTCSLEWASRAVSDDPGGAEDPLVWGLASESAKNMANIKKRGIFTGGGNTPGSEEEP